MLNFEQSAIDHINRTIPADQILRITVKPSGCSGYRYVYSYAESTTDRDEQFKVGDRQVVVDSLSMGLLDGSTLYVEEQGPTRFKKMLVRNPKEIASCGCGESVQLETTYVE